MIGYNVTLLYGHMLIMDTCMLETVKFFPQWKVDTYIFSNVVMYVQWTLQYKVNLGLWTLLLSTLKSVHSQVSLYRYLYETDT